MSQSTAAEDPTGTGTGAGTGSSLNSSSSSNYVSVSVFDLLLIELIPLAERMAVEYEASLDRPSAVNKSFSSSSSSSASSSQQQQPNANGNTNPAQTQLQQQQQQQQQHTTTPTPTTTTTPTTNPAAPAAVFGGATTSEGQTITPLMRELISHRLDALGYRVGLGLSERFSRDRPRFVDHLDVIKFLCKDLWTVVWKKQIDNLKTNHRGVFVLTDAKFRPLSRMSMANNAEAVARAQVHLIFPCGIIRGVLSSLGIQASVQAESTELPTATFQIKTSGAKV